MNERGFTLVEVTISLGLLAIVMASLFGVIISSQRDYVRQRDAVHSQEAIRAAENIVSTSLRAGGADPFDVGGAGIDPDPLDHGAFDNLRVVSDYNPPDGDFADPNEDLLVWVDADTLYARLQAGQQPYPLAYPVVSLELEYYDADGNVLSTEAAVASSAVRARYRLTMRKNVRTGSHDVREAFVHLRNQS